MSNVPPPPPPGRHHTAATAGPGRQPQSAAAYDPAPTPPVADADRTIAVGGPSNLKIFGAEIVGTFVLMIVGPGTAILAVRHDGHARHRVGVRPRSAGDGVHDRSRLGLPHQPGGDAVVLLTRKITMSRPGTTGSPRSSAGCSADCAVHHLQRRRQRQDRCVRLQRLGHNLGVPFGIWAAILVEIFFTALLIFVVLSTTTKGYPVGFGGLAVGLTLAMIHLATIPVDNTSVNPARSIGTAVFGGWDA